MPSKVQLTGGGFQDSEGNVLALGYLEMVLSQDGAVAGVGQVASGITIRITLNSSGNVDTGSPQSIWGNDQLLPANSYYRVTGYTAAGQPAWGPNNQQVNGSGGTFDVGTWTPNQVLSWTPPLSFPLLETNGVVNSRQDLQNITGSGGTSASESSGTVTITSLAPKVDIACFTPGVLANAQVLLPFNVVHNITLPISLTGSIATALVASTGTATINIKKNGTIIGSIVFTASATGTFTFASQVTCVPTDVISFVSASADATLSGVSFTITTTRTS